VSFPALSKVDANNGMPKMLCAIVSVPLPLIVSTPPNNE